MQLELKALLGTLKTLFCEGSLPALHYRDISYHSEEGGVPVESEDLDQGEGHVEHDEEEVGDAEDQDQDVLGCQHHLGVE